MEQIRLFERRKGETSAKAVVRNISNYSLYILLILMITLVSMVSQDFFTVDNFVNLFRQISISGVAAIGMTFIMLIDEIDLSAGANAALAGVIACMLLKDSGILWICRHSGGHYNCHRDFRALRRTLRHIPYISENTIIYRNLRCFLYI